MSSQSYHPPSASANPQTQLRRYSLGALGVAGGALALAPQQASAAFIDYDFEGSFTLESGGLDASQKLPDEGQPETSKIKLQGSNDEGYIRALGVSAWDHNATVQVGDFTFPVPRVLDPGSLITPTDVAGTPANNDTAYMVLNGVPQGDWVNSFADKIIGFRTTNGNLGYLNVSWNVTTLTLNWADGAVDIQGVPEPTTLALLAAGAVGLARRRRASQALAA